jgi:hypothetical protein
MTRSRLQDIVVAAALLVLVCGLGLGVMTFLPLEFTPPRPS